MDQFSPYTSKKIQIRQNFNRIKLTVESDMDIFFFFLKDDDVRLYFAKQGTWTHAI